MLKIRCIIRFGKASLGRNQKFLNSALDRNNSDEIAKNIPKNKKRKYIEIKGKIEMIKRRDL